MAEDHEIGGGFSEGELQFASFWVKNRVKLRRIGFGALIGANVLLWGFTIWNLLDAYAISYPRESRITSNIANNQFLASQLEANVPQSIETDAVNVFQNTDNRLDFLIPVRNPNKDWWAEFTYRFNVSGEFTPERSGFILPEEKTYLGEFGFKPQTKGGRSGVLSVDNIRWHRNDPKIVGTDYAAWAKRRFMFTTENMTYDPNLTIAGKPFSRSSFTFVNPSAYGYWNVKLYVVLKRTSNPVAATSVTLERVKAGEKRPVTIDWFEHLSAISNTEVVPVVNIFETSVYLPTSQQ
jgi:hypothetical protein